MRELLLRLLKARRDGGQIAGSLYADDGGVVVRNMFSLDNADVYDDSIEIRDDNFVICINADAIKNCQYDSDEDCYDITTDSINLSLTFM